MILIKILTFNSGFIDRIISLSKTYLKSMREIKFHQKLLGYMGYYLGPNLNPSNKPVWHSGFSGLNELNFFHGALYSASNFACVLRVECGLRLVTANIYDIK